jgi:ORF6N domain
VVIVSGREALIGTLLREGKIKYTVVNTILMQLQAIQQKIYELRGQKVLLDFDLAVLYEVETKRLNEAVKRNQRRFPADFMFRLTAKEWDDIRSQFATTSEIPLNMMSQIATSSQKKRIITARPFAFTEQGVSMLSSVLRSDKAIDVNIAIMRAFVFIRQYALGHKDLTDKLKELETKYDRNFADVYEALNYLLNKDKIDTDQKNRRRIGFKNGSDDV